MYSTFHFKVVSLLRHKQIKQNPIISNHVMYGILKGGKSVQNWGKPLVFPNGLFYDSLRFLRSTGCFPNIPPQPTNRSPAKPRGFLKSDSPTSSKVSLVTRPKPRGFLDVLLEVRINGLVNGLFHLLINGVYWGYNPLILTVYWLLGTSKKSRSFAPQERFFREIKTFLTNQQEVEHLASLFEKGSIFCKDPGSPKLRMRMEPK